MAKRTYETCGKGFTSRAKAERYARNIANASGVRVPVYETTGVAWPCGCIGNAGVKRCPQHGEFQVFEVSYQVHKYADRSDNPKPRVWRIMATNVEDAFRIAQLRAEAQRKAGRNVGHVYREVRKADGSIETAEGNYL